METIGDNDIFYRIVLEQPDRAWYEFWSSKTKQVTYLGNQLGFYEQDTGFSVSSARIHDILISAVRSKLLKAVVAEEESKAKPHLSIIKKEDD
jgi:hypothetical protein